jgi:hypothetical protein
MLCIPLAPFAWPLSRAWLKPHALQHFTAAVLADAQWRANAFQIFHVAWMVQMLATFKPLPHQLDLRFASRPASCR